MMEVLGNVILTLVIGITVMVTAFAIIQKIFEEYRKSQKETAEALTKAISEIPKVVTDTVSLLTKIENERKEQEKYNAWKHAEMNENRNEKMRLDMSQPKNWII